MEYGYYRNPTLSGDTLVFVCEADLWSVSLQGGVARRLTLNQVDFPGPRFTQTPRLSPDGCWLAFVAEEEGSPEVYVMPAEGGMATRLTWDGARCLVTNWSPDGERILYASKTGQPSLRYYGMWSVPCKGGPAERVRVGPAERISYGPGGGVVIGRNVADPACWKRYRGGTAGELWIDPDGGGEFRRLVSLRGNLADPWWIGERVYFLSDHEGHGNVYSCTPAGEDLRRHTHHEDFYARNASTDGKRVVYQCGGRLFVLEPEDELSREVKVQVASARPQLRRRFVEAGDYLEGYHLHPKGHSLALDARGKTFSMGNWERAVRQHGERDGVRYRLTRWLHTGDHLVTVSDAGGEEALEVHDAKGNQEPRRLDGLDIGRPLLLWPSPTAAQVVLTNQRLQLLWIDLEAGKLKVLDTSSCGRIQGVSWAPDGRWVVYAFPGTMRTTHLRLARTETGAVHPITEPVHEEIATCFDPQGKYLYFLSQRTFNPVYDRMVFDLGFPRGGRPYAITLRADLRSPFDLEPRPLESEKNNEEKGKDESPEPVEIDLEGIAGRIVVFPVEEGIYGGLAAVEGKVFYDTWPVEGALGRDWLERPKPKGTLKCYDLETRKEETFASKVNGFHLSGNGKTLCYRSGKKLRVVKAGEKPKQEGGDEPGRESGWIDLSRPRVSVVAAAEWQQMYREAWRLQRDNFWTPDMSGVDWEEVYRRYLPVLERVATREEFSDLMWEIQGELGTSHAYEFGGDRRQAPLHGPGILGADFAWQGGRWEVTHVVRGESWVPDQDSPLNAPGVNVQAGQVLLAIDGQPLNDRTPPGRLLVNAAGMDVDLTMADGDEQRTVTVRTLKDEQTLRYREWVETNRRRVHEASEGEVGYVHVPDMGPLGFSEFHRYHLQEAERKGLLVDVRYNGGGHVSQLVLEKLARRRIGYDIPRYGQPMAYPGDSVLGPIVCLTNEYAGSDGDIFSHCFKLMKLGPLIGKRTWGGVIGIWPCHPLVDGTITTQAEFAFWFVDVGWEVENYGTDPDIEVDITPQDWVAGRDPQLDRGIQVIRDLLAEQAPTVPDFGPRPRLAAPKLPS